MADEAGHSAQQTAGDQTQQTQTTQTTTAPKKPDGMPDKFWNPEDPQGSYAALAKGYNEAQKLISTTRKGDAIASPLALGAQPAAAPKTLDDAIKAANLDASALVAHVAEHGALDDASALALEQHGFARETAAEVLTARVSRVRSAQERAKSEAVRIAGGEAQLGNLLTWGSANLNADDRAFYDKAMASNSVSEATAAILMLKQRHEEAVSGGTARALVQGDGGVGGGGPMFKTQADLTKAVASQKYANDPAYRAEVDAQIKRMAAKRPYADQTFSLPPR